MSPVFDGRKYDLPTPVFCPHVRMQQKAMFRNERNLYQRTCDLTHAPIISMYRPEALHPVYEPRAWWSDDWSPLDYGQKMDFSRPFFGQFIDLQHATPRMALLCSDLENSPYVNHAKTTKDSHLSFSAFEAERVLYSTGVVHSKDVQDSFFIVGNNEKIYESLYCDGCYDLLFCNECSGCSNSMFLQNCTQCRDCLFCINLSNKQYHIFNEPHSKQEYERIKKELDLEKDLDMHRQKFATFCHQHPHKCVSIKNCENVIGDYCDHAHDACVCRNLSQAERCKYVEWCAIAKDAQDCYGLGRAEWVYNSHAIEGSQQILCSHISYANQSSCYLDGCHNSHDCF